VYAHYSLPLAQPLRLLNRMLNVHRIKYDALQQICKVWRATALLAIANEVIEKRIAALPVWVIQRQKNMSAVAAAFAESGRGSLIPKIAQVL
jgi:hypothetical protein